MWKAWFELAVAAGVEAVAVGASGGDGDRCAAGEARELRVGLEALDAGDLADQLGRDQYPDSLLCQELWCELSHQAGELLIQFGDRAGQLADATDHVAGDPHPDLGWIGVLQAAGDLDLPGGQDEHPLGDRPVGPEVVQLPAQLVDQPGAVAHEPLAVQPKQPDLKLGAGQTSGRERFEPFA